MLSNLYQDIHVFRYSDRTGNVFILAGVNDGIEINIYRNGLWEFNDEARF